MFDPLVLGFDLLNAVKDATDQLIFDNMKDDIDREREVERRLE